MNLRGVLLILFLRHTTENNKDCSYDQMKDILKKQGAETKQYLIENREEIEKILENQKKERTQKQKKSAANRNKMALNVKSDLKPTIFKCKRCRSNFISEKKLNEHLITVHSKENHGRKKTECTVCREVYFRKYLLIRHMKKNHEELKLICKKCEGEFYFVKDLEKHECINEHIHFSNNNVINLNSGSK